MSRPVSKAVRSMLVKPWKGKKKNPTTIKFPSNVHRPTFCWETDKKKKGVVTYFELLQLDSPRHRLHNNNKCDGNTAVLTKLVNVWYIKIKNNMKWRRCCIVNFAFLFFVKLHIIVECTHTHTHR